MWLPSGFFWGSISDWVQWSGVDEYYFCFDAWDIVGWQGVRLELQMVVGYGEKVTYRDVRWNALEVSVRYWMLTSWGWMVCPIGESLEEFSWVKQFQIVFRWFLKNQRDTALHSLHARHDVYLSISTDFFLRVWQAY